MKGQGTGAEGTRQVRKRDHFPFVIGHFSVGHFKRSRKRVLIGCGGFAAFRQSLRLSAAQEQQRGLSLALDFGC
jgi:hypothetical protein